MRRFSFLTAPAGDDRRVWEVGSLGNATSFGENSRGELYLPASGGRVLRMVPAP